MTDIYRQSLDAKYQAILQVVAADLFVGNNLTALTAEQLKTVQDAVDQAIFEWALRRRTLGSLLRPATNLQHLLDEYCAIADHL